MQALGQAAALERLPLIARMRHAWAEAWRTPGFRGRALFTAVGLTAALHLLAAFSEWVESRPGVTLRDPLLEMLQPRDLTWITFLLIYLPLLAIVLRLSREPRALLFGMQAYAVLALLRLVAMSLVPLDAPPGMIILRDPMVQTLGTKGEALTKDLFFSGHTATLYLLFLLEEDKRAKQLFLAGTFAIAACVLVQHVHYSVDVLVAPLFADLAYRIARRMRLS